MASVDEVSDLKQRVERLRRESDKAQGALEQSMARLKKDWDCDTVEDAKRKLKKLERDEGKAKEEFDSAMAEFEKKWGAVLDL